MALKIYFKIITQYKLVLCLMLSMVLPNLTLAQTEDNTNSSSIKNTRGYISRKSVKNKDSKIEERTDYYFQEINNDTIKDQILIKVSDSQISEQEMGSMITKTNNHALVNVDIQNHHGYIDVPQKEQEKGIQYQSRVGDYITIHSLSLMDDTNQTFYSGKFQKMQQVNKAGKKLKTYDYFFVDEKTGKQYFIKFNKKTISIDDMEQHIIYSAILNNVSKPLNIKAVVKQGLWDTNDPKQQSRVGEYIHIYQIMPD